MNLKLLQIHDFLLATWKFHFLHCFSSSYQVLIPHLVFLNDFEQVKSIGRCLEKDWKLLLADCFPKIMVNILPYFALPGQDSQVAQQREKAHRVYDLLKDASCLGKQVKAAHSTGRRWASDKGDSSSPPSTGFFRHVPLETLEQTQISFKGFYIISVLLKRRIVLLGLHFTFDLFILLTTT